MDKALVLKVYLWPVEGGSGHALDELVDGLGDFLAERGYANGEGEDAKIRSVIAIGHERVFDEVEEGSEKDSAIERGFERMTQGSEFLVIPTADGD